MCLPGHQPAAWLSVIASARRHEFESWAYHTEVLSRLPPMGPDPADAQLEPLLPDRWIAEHPAARLPLNRGGGAGRRAGACGCRLSDGYE